jgi:thioredoxin reductase (NADPH)
MTSEATSELVETPDRFGAYPRLSDEQIAALTPHGERRTTSPDEILFRQGDEHYDFYVVLGGLVAVIDGDGPDGELIAVHGPGRFLGELGLLTGQAAFFTAVVREGGEALVVPVERLRAMLSTDSALGDLILRAYLLRRELLIGRGAGLRIVGSRFSADARRLREFVARNRLPHRWIDVERDGEAEALLREIGVPPDETPVVIWHGEVLRNPSNAELAHVVGLAADHVEDELCDLVVVGAGPAGLAASVYGASEGLSTTVLDAVATGGQAGTSSKIENYLGFPSGISGAELAERASIQARKFGAQITVPAEATALERVDGHYRIRWGDEGHATSAQTVVIATGARYRKLAVPRLEELEGAGVYYAATLMEAQICSGDPVVVVGGGNSAGQAAIFLSRHASHVTLIIRHDDLDRDMSRYLADRVERDPKIELRAHTEIRELIGGDALQAVVVEDVHTGEREELPARELFVFIGADPCTTWLGDQVALDERGYILTGPEAARARDTDGDGNGGGDHHPMMLETSLPGVLAVGDVRASSVKRVASAVGEGAMAVRLVHQHLHERVA